MEHKTGSVPGCATFFAAGLILFFTLKAFGGPHGPSFFFVALGIGTIVALVFLWNQIRLNFQIGMMKMVVGTMVFLGLAAVLVSTLPALMAAIMSIFKGF